MLHFPIKNNDFIKYLIKFISIFCILYFGTIALIGLAAPGGYYLSFLDKYFNYISWLRASLLITTKFFLKIIGIATYSKDIYTIAIQNGRSLHIVYSCLGYGIMSFWAAFVLANEDNKLKKISWLFGGLFIIWLINVWRIFLLLLSINNKWNIPFGFNHHTLFTIFAYLGIFIMIYFYDKSAKRNLKGYRKNA